MIKIKFASHDEDLGKWFKDSIYSIHKDEFMKNVRKLDNILKKYAIPYCFDEIITLKYCDLESIKGLLLNQLNHSLLTKMNNEINNLKYKINDKYTFLVVQYKAFREKYGKEFVQRIGITVCPYCNRNFINNGRDRATAQLDHFFNKAKFPLFAISLYNLIPCCYSCNHIKHTYSIGYSPYNHNFETDQMLTFDYILKELNNYEIIIKPNKIYNSVGTEVTNPIVSNIQELQLIEQYNIHIDLLKQLLFKVQKMPKTYLIELSNLLKDNVNFDLGMNEEELFYDNYLSEVHYHLRPLSKFTRDIVKNIKEIQYKEI